MLTHTLQPPSLSSPLISCKEEKESMVEGTSWRWLEYTQESSSGSERFTIFFSINVVQKVKTNKIIFAGRQIEGGRGNWERTYIF